MAVRSIGLDYFQPDGYHFSEDSLFLINNVVDDYKDKTIGHLVDLGAGSGILGIELARLVRVDQVTFCEKQSPFFSHLEKNVQHFLPEQVKYNYFFDDWNNVSFGEQVDVVISNPPFYLEENHRPSKNTFKQTCRQWSFKDLDNYCLLLKKLKSCFTSQIFILTTLHDEKQTLINTLKKLELECDIISTRTTYQVLRVF